MLDTWKTSILNQYEAAFCTLNECIAKCPEPRWQLPVVNNPFSQSVFHTLFFADLYLGQNMDAQPGQGFHQKHTETFADYEQLESRRATETYEKSFILEYLQFCRDKAASVVSGETAEELQARSGFPWIEGARAEVHVYNIRHIQHHAAQLIAVLRKDPGIDLPWVRSGWQEFAAS